MAAQIVRERRRFLSFLRARTGSDDEAEEVLQAALARSLEAADALRDDERVVPWFYRILRNALVDRARARAAEARALERFTALSAEPTSTASDEAALRELVCGCVTRLLDTMPEPAATLLRRVELDDEPLTRIASELGATANAIGVRVHRARRALRARVQACCGACHDPTCHDCDCTGPG